MNLFIMLDLLKQLRQLRQHERWTRPQLEVYQTKKLGELRAYAYAYSPFYQRFHRGLLDRPLSELPVLTKAMLMENYEDLVTDRTLHLEDIRAFAQQGEAGKPFRGQYWVTATSGSSGQPGFFLFNEKEWGSVLASFARSQEWSGVKIDLTHRQRMATVASLSAWHMSSQVSATVKSWWRPSLRLAANQPLSQIVSQLNDWQPEVLITYASMAGILAEEQRAGRLKIQPKVVYTSSEVLTRQTRQSVYEVWGHEPYNQYAATETATIAAEHSTTRQMHVFEDLVLVEVVDEKNQPVPPGEFGAKLLITTLFSRTQPLIRYELKDSICMRPAGRTDGLPFAVMESIQGREEDTLKLPAIAGGWVEVQPLVFNRVMDILPVVGWQVAQQPDHGLLILFASARNGLSSDDLRDQLIRTLALEGVQVPYVKVQQVETIPKNASGKAPLIIAHPVS